MLFSTPFSIFFKLQGTPFLHLYCNVWRDIWMGDSFQSCINEKKRFQINGNTFGTPLGIRTLDPLIKSQLLYQLS